MNDDISEPSRRPKESRFRQQMLPAWQPMFTAKKSAITFLVISVIFIPLGVVFLLTSNAVIEYTVDYTDCLKLTTTHPCSESVVPGTFCTCSVPLKVTSDIPGPVYVYYELTNFFQNHRRYARSRDDLQLRGDVQSPSSLSSCAPYAVVTNSTSTYAILPCGAIANSIFNDTVKLSYQSSGSGTVADVLMTNKGIAWKSDVDRKFGTLSPEALKDTVKPPNWLEPIEKRSPGPFKTDEPLMVWMRPSALPTFRKLFGRIVHEGLMKDGLPAGTYTLEIQYAFPVTSFEGRKSFVVGNVSWLGGKNITLGVAFLVTGSIHVLLGIAFLVVYIFNVRSAASQGAAFSSPLLVGRKHWQSSPHHLFHMSHVPLNKFSVSRTTLYSIT